MLDLPRMGSLPQFMKNASEVWVPGLKSMERPYIPADPGLTKMTLSLLECGEYKYIFSVKPLHTLQWNLFVYDLYKSHDCTTLKPNVTVEWLTHLLCIREVLGSKLGPDTGYP